MKNKEAEIQKLKGENEAAMKGNDKARSERAKNKNEISDLKAEQTNLKIKLTEKDRSLEKLEEALNEERMDLRKNQEENDTFIRKQDEEHKK